MLEVYRGSVQTWECDGQGHFNVRFYLARVADGLAGLASALGLGRAHETRLGRGLVAIEHHIRFHRELLPGSPLVLDAGVLEASEFGLRVYFALRRPPEQEPAATFVAEVRYVGLDSRDPAPLPQAALVAAQAHQVELPDAGRPRGLEIAPPRPSPTLAEADRLGLWPIYRGVVRSSDCDAHGRFTPEAFMARLSDGLPNLFGSMLEGLAVTAPGGSPTDDPRASGDLRIGGAAVEYRMIYRAMPCSGDLLCVRSGLRSLTDKTLGLVHWLFDTETAKAVATAEAIAVTLDLAERRARPLAPEWRRHLETKLLPELSL